MITTPEELEAEVLRIAGAGLPHAIRFLEDQIREVMGVPAPRGEFFDSKGQRHIISLTKAIAGAPPRKLTGTLRSGLFSAMVSDTEGEVGIQGGKTEDGSGELGIIARSMEYGWMSRKGSWFPVAVDTAEARSKRGRTLKLRKNEVKWIPILRDKRNEPHAFLHPTLEKNRDNLVRIIGQPFEVA